MVKGLKERTDSLPEGVTEGDLEKAVLEEDRTAEYRPMPVEELRVAIEGWAAQSLVVARILNLIRVRDMMRRGAKAERVKELDQEIKRLTDEQAVPAKAELSAHTQMVISLFADNPLLRTQVANFSFAPTNLRGLVKKGLYARKIDVREMCDRADEIEKEREKRALENV